MTNLVIFYLFSKFFFNFFYVFLNLDTSKLMRLIEFREALREAMSEEMRRDEKIFLMAFYV